MSKTYSIIVHTIVEDGLPPEDFAQANLTGRVVFIFDGCLYSGWPLRPAASDYDAVVWEESETGTRFSGVKKWIELPVTGWEL